MGLAMDGDTPYVLTDIADAEDFAGDMDFKVTGTEQGVTAIPDGHESPRSADRGATRSCHGCPPCAHILHTC